MKTDNQDLTTDTEAGKLKPQNSLIISILPFLSMLLAILLRLVVKPSGMELAKLGIITLLLTGALSFYIRINIEVLQKKKLSKTILSVSYLVSLCLLLLIPNPETFSFWMLGGLLTAMLIDNKLGLLLQFNLSFIMGITFNLRPETIIWVLIIGVLMSMLSGALKEKSSVIYAAIILLSANITLAFAVNNFIFEKASNLNYLNSLFSILAVLIMCYALVVFYNKLSGGLKTPEGYPSMDPSEIAIAGHEEVLPKINSPDTSVHAAALVTEVQARESSADVDNPADADIIHNLGIRTSYDVLCGMENELIQKMKQHSEDLYIHAVQIGDLSFRAARVIGANEMLAQAGGLYHEVGKIRGKNYIEEGLSLAEEYSFPTELKAIIQEHNIKYGKPGSIEAAIVMLSDNVTSTIEYVQKTKDQRFTTDKIIDNIFQLRMEKGTFDACSLSLKDFKQLKEFYQKEFIEKKSNT